MADKQGGDALRKLRRLMNRRHDKGTPTPTVGPPKPVEGHEMDLGPIKTTDLGRNATGPIDIMRDPEVSVLMAESSMQEDTARETKAQKRERELDNREFREANKHVIDEPES